MSRDETATFSTPTGDYAVRIRCPHCGNRIQLVESGEREVVCGSCGSAFRVDPDATNSLAPEKLPKHVGRFVVLARLGRGAFGTVYKATDPDLDRVVAVKVPRAGFFATADEEARFLREAKAAAKLQHPGVVTVHEVADGDPPAIVSEFIDGMTLADRLTGGRPTFRESAELIAALADALDYAHRNGVVHRDVKPSNVLLDSAGKPHLADFGLARRDEAEITVTVDGQVLGTPAYMSPEQAAGKAAVDGRADVYSLGVMLYELLAGELPFRGNARMLLHQVLHDDPTPPRKRNDHIPRDLETVCLKALAKVPARRYATAGELAADLRRWLAGQPVLARPVGRLERGWRWAMRNRAVAGLLAAVLVVLAAGATTTGFYAVTWKRTADRLDEELKQSARREGELTVEKGITLCDRGEVKAGLLWQAKGLAMLERTGADEQDVWHARMNLSLWGQSLTTPAVRYNGELQQAELVAGRPLFVARTVAVGVSHDVGLHDLTAGKLIHTFPRPGPLNLASGNPQFRVSADGRSLGTVHTVFSDEKRSGMHLVVTVWDLDTRAERSRFRIDSADPRTLMVCPVVWSPGLNVVAVGAGISATGDDEYRLYDVRSGKPVPTIDPKLPTRVEFAPDDRSALIHIVRTARLIDLPSGRRLTSLTGEPAPAFRPDGGEVVGWDNGRVSRYDARTGQPTGPGFDCPFVPDSLGFTNDGKWLTARKEDAADGESAGPWRAWAWPSGDPWGHRDVHPAHVTADGAVALLDGYRPVRWPSREPLGRPLQMGSDLTGFSPDGAVTVLRREGYVEGWSVRCGRRLGPSDFGLRTPWDTSAVRWDKGSGELVVHGIDGKGKLYVVRRVAPVGGSAERITVWAEALTGMTLDEGGTARPLDEATLAERKRRLEELGGSPLPKP